MSDTPFIASLHWTSLPSPKTVLIEELEVVFVRDRQVFEAQRFISACEACSADATMPFDYVLEELAEGESGPTTEYLMCRLAVCPSCNQAITEKTLVNVS